MRLIVLQEEGLQLATQVKHGARRKVTEPPTGYPWCPGIHRAQTMTYWAGTQLGIRGMGGDCPVFAMPAENPLGCKECACGIEGAESVGGLSDIFPPHNPRSHQTSRGTHGWAKTTDKSIRICASEGTPQRGGYCMLALFCYKLAAVFLFKRSKKYKKDPLVAIVPRIDMLP